MQTHAKQRKAKQVTFRVGDLFIHKELGRCVIIATGGDTTLKQLHQKGDVLVDDDNNPIGLVNADSEPAVNGTTIHLVNTSGRPLDDCHIRNLSREQRLAAFRQVEAGEESRVLLESLGLA